MRPRQILFLSETAEGLFMEILPWMLLGLAIIVGGAFVLIALRRFMRYEDSDTDSHAFTLKSLRDLHAKGELTDDEFENAKAAMIGQLKGAAASETDKKRAVRSNADEPAREQNRGQGGMAKESNEEGARSDSDGPIRHKTEFDRDAAETNAETPDEQTPENHTERKDDSNEDGLAERNGNRPQS